MSMIRRAATTSTPGALALLALGLATTTACFSPKYETCAVQCGDEGACPSELVCLSDGYCHESILDTLCSNPGDPDAAQSDAAPQIDAEPADAALIDAEIPVDAALPMSAGDLIITEIMKDACVRDGMGICTVSDFNAEWIEVFNPGSVELDMQGMILRDLDPTKPDVATIDESVIVPAGGFVVLGRNANTAINGNVAIDFDYADFFMGNGDDEVELATADGTVIDSVSYTESAFPDVEGIALSLSADAIDATLNDTGANWCEAVTPFGDGDLGTPGQANPACP